MRIAEIDNEYYVFRNGVKVTMAVKQMGTGKFIRSDTGFLGDKHVPNDVIKKIQEFQKTN